MMSIHSTRLLFGAEPLFTGLSELRRARRGNKISRFLRPFFSHKQLKRIVGTNLAVLAIASSTLPQIHAADPEASEQIISVKNTQVETTLAVSLPIKNIIINQYFSLWHPGIDLDGETGDTIMAITKGVVTEVARSRFAYGNAVTVKHGGEMTSLYAHLSKIEVTEGQEVEAGEKLGEMGSTGWSTGSHLHLEIHENGRPINPLTVLPIWTQR